MTTKTVLFDLDGTLLNTLGDIADAINHAMRALSHPEKTDAEVLAAIGNGIRRAIATVLPGIPSTSEINAAHSIFNEKYYECYMNKTQPYPGILEILQTLRRHNYKIAVISNKPDLYTCGLIEKHFGALVDATAGERPGVPLKPAPDAVLSIISKVGGDPANTVYVGDSEVDVATAKNAGIPCVLVSWGFRSRDTLLRVIAESESESNGNPYPIILTDNANETLSAILNLLL